MKKQQILVTKRAFIGLFSILSFVSCLFFSQHTVYAKSASPGSDSNEGIIANVALTNPQLVQEGTEISVSFTLSNEKNTQTGIRYGARIVPKGSEPLSLAGHEFIQDESLSIAPNTSYERKIKFTIPSYLSGEYDLFLVAKNKSGIMLSLIFGGVVTASGNNQYVALKNETCFLSLPSEGNGATRYSLDQGVDVSKEEILVLNCEVENRTLLALLSTPRYQIFERTTFGNRVLAKSSKAEAISLRPNEKKNVQFSLPLPERPQAYDIKASLESDQKVPSNEVVAHIVLQGSSATVQNITLDKDSYFSGEKALVTVLLTGSADGFFDSRKKIPGFDGKGNLALSLGSGGDKCSGVQKQAIDISKTGKQQITIDVTRDCRHPFVNLSLTDSNGQKLISEVYDFSSAKNTVLTNKKPIAEEDQSNSALTVFPFLVVFAIIVIVLLVLGKRLSSRYIKVLFIALISWGAMLNVEHAYAASSASMSLPYEAYCDTCDPTMWFNHALNIVGSINKARYAPSENIHLSSAMSYMACANSARWGRWRVTNSWDPSWSYAVDAQGGRDVPEIRSINTTLTAPNNPGEYSLFIRWFDPRGLPPWYNPITKSWRYDVALRGQFDKTMTLTFKVEAPASIEATCNSAYNAKTLNSIPSTGLCSSGNQTSVSDMGTRWQWSCSGSKETVSCSANKKTADVFYNLTVQTSGQGTVTSNDGGINCGANCGKSYKEGANIFLSPLPSKEYEFDHWEGDCSGNMACSVIMTSTKNVIAYFKQKAVPICTCTDAEKSEWCKDATFTKNCSTGGTAQCVGTKKCDYKEVRP